MLEVLLPLPCAGCGGRVVVGVPLCARCAATLSRAPRVGPPAGIDAWVAPFAYEGAARELVARIKYRNVRAVVPWLARCMADTLTGDEINVAAVGGAAITWAPTTPERRRARGFDPAELLARAVARRVRLPAMALLTRLPGPPQTGQPVAVRRAGPRFMPRRSIPASLIVVDDIATTGATLSAAGLALRAGGAERVVALTAARTPRPGSG
ncbi:MAG: hypothetical protein WEB19_05325 [Acidimicrobiia bacterium]